MRRKEGISCLLKYETIPETIRYCAVNNNLDVLLSFDTPDMTAEDLETLIAAARINPLPELTELLTEIRSGRKELPADNRAAEQIDGVTAAADKLPDSQN